jgi:hypothetical protein
MQVLITAITSFGGSWYGDRLLASRADRVIRIEQPSKKLIRLFYNGRVFDYVPVPPGQIIYYNIITTAIKVPSIPLSI